jgi:hypothetical protein
MKALATVDTVSVILSGDGGGVVIETKKVKEGGGKASSLAGG